MQFAGVSVGLIYSLIKETFSIAGEFNKFPLKHDSLGFQSDFYSFIFSTF